MTDFRGLLDALVSGGVDFILIGGVAATIHGSTRLTTRLRCTCLGLEGLITVKRAAGRPKGFEAVAELEALHEERDRDPDRDER